MVEPRELVMYVNGRFVSLSQGIAELQGTDVESSGGFYDSERTFDGQVFKLRQHLERLYRGLDYTNIDPGMTLDEMAATTMELLEANRPLLKQGGEFVLTQVVSVGSGPSPEVKSKVNVLIHCRPLDFASFARSYVLGVRVITPATYGVPQQTQQSTAREATQRVLPLMTSAEGGITECKGGNFMFVRDGRIKLPDRRNVLPGISMHTVLELAEVLEIPIDEDDYSTHDVYLAEEAFVSSTRNCIVPVDTLNGLRLSRDLPGPTTRRLMDAWRELVGLDFVRQALDHLPPDDPGAASGRS